MLEIIVELNSNVCRHVRTAEVIKTINFAKNQLGYDAWPKEEEEEEEEEEEIALLC